MKHILVDESIAYLTNFDLLLTGSIPARFTIRFIKG